MRKFRTLQNDNPSDVSVTSIRAFVNHPKPHVDGAYNNTARMANSSQVNKNSNPAVALLTLNPRRCMLILQNNSSVINPADVAPILYFGFGTNPVPGFDLQLSPGEGLVLDKNCPTDPIYVAVGPFTNGFGSVTVAGLVKENSITDPAAHNTGGSNEALNTLIALLTQLLAPKAA